MPKEELKALAEQAYAEDRMCCVREIMEVYLKYNADDARGWYLYADAQRVLGVFGASAVSFHKALMNCPDDVRWAVQARLGLLFSNKGDHVTAERWYSAALEATDAQLCGWLLVLRGKGFLWQELVSEAEKCFRDAIAVDPHDDEALLLLATVLAGQKKYSDSLASIRAMKTVPENVEGFAILQDLKSMDQTNSYLNELRFE